jgi:hypothetical protein
MANASAKKAAISSAKQVTVFKPLLIATTLIHLFLLFRRSNEHLQVFTSTFRMLLALGTLYGTQYYAYTLITGMGNDASAVSRG